MLSQLKSLYRSLPPFMTGCLRYVSDGIIFGKSYRECITSTSVNGVDVSVKRALDYAREHTEWGRIHVPKVVEPGNAVATMKSLPVVSAEELRAEARQFVSDQVRKYNSYWTTTGETGRNPTNVCLSNQSYGIEWAHMLNIWCQGGYDRRKDRKLTLRGYHFRPGEVLRLDPIYNEVGLDSFQLTDENFISVVDRISRYGIKCIHGYPTLICSFMERLRAHGLSMRVREIMLASEGCTPEKKLELSNFFSAKVLSWYGLTEKVVLAYDSDATGRFKVFTSYGIPWVYNPDASGVGEIVGTTFVNWAMPLVNYRTGDYGRVVCDGDALYIENLQGRSGKDFVLETKDIKYPVTAINLPGEVQDKIVFYQIVQNEYARIEVLALPRVEFMGKADVVREELCREIKARLSHFDVSVRIVNDESAFDRSKRGKFRMIVQNIHNAVDKIRDT